MTEHEAKLGLATTEDLFRELIVRFTIHYPPDAITQLQNAHRAIMLAEMLGGLGENEREYRTIDYF